MGDHAAFPNFPHRDFGSARIPRLLHPHEPLMPNGAPFVLLHPPRVSCMQSFSRHPPTRTHAGLSVFTSPASGRHSSDGSCSVLGYVVPAATRRRVERHNACPTSLRLVMCLLSAPHHLRPERPQPPVRALELLDNIRLDRRVGDRGVGPLFLVGSPDGDHDLVLSATHTSPVTRRQLTASQKRNPRSTSFVGFLTPVNAWSTNSSAICLAS